MRLMDETFIFYLDRPLSTSAFYYTSITEVSSYTYLHSWDKISNSSNLVGTSFTRSFKTRDQLDFGPIRGFIRSVW